MRSPLAALPPELRELVRRPELLVGDEVDTRAPPCTAGNLDYVAVKAPFGSRWLGLRRRPLPGLFHLHSVKRQPGESVAAAQGGRTL